MSSSTESIQEETKEKSEFKVTIVKITSSNFFSAGLPPSGLPAFISNSKIQSSYILEEETPAEKRSHGLFTTKTSPAICQQFEKRPPVQASGVSGSPNLKK